jgi:hypothetical protein
MWCILRDDALGLTRTFRTRLERRFIAAEFALQPDFALLARRSGFAAI